MRFSINQSELQSVLSVVSKGMSTRSTLPILAGIYLEAAGAQLTLQSTDLELSVRCSVAALVEEEGRAVLPGKLFESIVKSLPDAAVVVEERDGQATIRCDASSFSVKTLDADDFPGFPHVDVQQEIRVPFPEFSSMVKKVSRFVSRDESRAVLTGVLISLAGDVLTLVSTDSYRLAVVNATIPDAGADEFTAVVKGSFLQELAALPRSEDPVTLALADNQIVIGYQDVTFVNRRIEGNYPNYRALLAATPTTRVTVDRLRLAAAVKRVAVVGQSSAPVRFDVNEASQTIMLTAATQDVGEACETVPCSCEGLDVQIAFNNAYTSEGLAASETDEVVLELQGSMKPGVVRSTEGEDYLYLIMPVRLS